jgi:C1A family cysteine protease
MATLDFNVNSNNFNPGYAIELEDRIFLQNSSTAARLLTMGDLPTRVDPRQTDLYKNEKWIQVEDQASMGSCQGQALTECGEFCYTVLSGRVIQLSRIYAYLRSQQFDNIRTDSGSTLSGGTKCALEGICLESIAPYPSRYPGWNYLTQDMKNDAKNYILKTHTSLKKEDEVKRYIGSGLGIVQIGISWGNDMNPDSTGCIRAFSGRGGGGHSVVFAGYIPDSDIGVRSSSGYWYLLKNSWSQRWGKQGFAYVDPKAVAQMLTHQWTVMIGRSDMDVPEPRPIHVDFTKKGNSING